MAHDSARPRVVRAPLTEEEGCALLRIRFEAAGLAIQERYRFQEEGLDIELDGFDPDRRTGYEYLTSAAGDRAQFTPAVVAALDRMMAAGSLALLLIDERGVDARTLDLAAERFLERVTRGGEV